ncbi:MAG: biotin/lipoyl-binding protein [Candidatus Bathyarchaeota archaeon]|nr:biotin/lipoyl-binding protein [Candidatus Bathyarchaeota archaeon]
MPVYEVYIDGKPRKIELTKIGENAFTVKIDGKPLKVELLTQKLELEKGFSIKIDDEKYQVNLPELKREELFSVRVEEAVFKAEVKTPTRKPTLTTFEPTTVTPTIRPVEPKPTLEGAVTAPMTGKILSIKVKKGEQVKAGQVLCILEAMKMENEIAAPKSGIVQEILVSEGSSVNEGEALFVII